MGENRESELSSGVATPLEQMIRAEIQAHGPMRFDRYMERALYHPAHGYYAGTRTIGRTGDFFTSVSVGPLFGRLLARQARQMWELLEFPRPFWIIEQGAHDGQLAVDILEGCRALGPDFSETVRYGIVEPSSSACDRQKSCLDEAGFGALVHWTGTVEKMAKEKPVGLFLSNELVDAFPVRVIRRHEGAWVERGVGLGENGIFCWIDLPLQDEELRRAIDELLLPEVENYVTEINLASRSWMREVGATVYRGYVLTIDYGFPASVYYAPFRVRGTLTAYRQHRREDDVLVFPGEYDITAHVDFTALAREGERGGLSTLGLVDQQRFLTGVAHDELSGGAGGAGIPEQLRAWNMLTHPGHLGSRFQVLVQAKDAPDGLDGLRYARAGGLD